MANGSFVSGDGAYLNVDMTEVQRTINLMRGLLTRQRFEQLMHRTFNEAGRKARTLISKEVYQDYYVTQRWVKSQIGHYRLTYGGSSPVTCTIPLSGAKGTIGGRFAATGGYKGRRIKAKIVRTDTSELPAAMKNQGGNPPFINRESDTLNGVAFTRRTKKRLPIVRVVGLGVPQMPLNRSGDSVQDALLDYIGNRLEHNFMFMFGKGG